MNHGWEYRKLYDVAPAKSFDGEIAPCEDKYWCLNLDKIESDTGRIIEYDYLESGNLHGSICKFSTENVLFSKLRPNLNKVVVPMQEGYCTTELVPLHPIKELNREFLSYYLRNPRFVKALVDKTGGAKMPRVKMNLFWGCEIPLPKLEIQNRIVSELDKINELIGVKRSQLADLDELAKSLFYEIFGDPITNPKEWKTVLIKDFLSLKAGKSIKASELIENPKDGYFPCFGDNGLRGYIAKKSHSGLYNIIGRQGALCGNITFAEGEFYATEHAVVVSPLIDISPRWLYYQFTIMNLNQYAKGVAQPGLSVSILNELTIPVPPLALQEKFEARIEQIEDQKKLIESSIADLQTLLASRMDYWFND